MANIYDQTKKVIEGISRNSSYQKRGSILSPMLEKDKTAAKIVRRRLTQRLHSNLSI